MAEPRRFEPWLRAAPGPKAETLTRTEQLRAVSDQEPMDAGIRGPRAVRWWLLALVVSLLTWAVFLLAITALI